MSDPIDPKQLAELTTRAGDTVRDLVDMLQKLHDLGTGSLHDLPAAFNNIDAAARSVSLAFRALTLAEAEAKDIAAAQDKGGDS